jgi:hypothetical protein
MIDTTQTAAEDVGIALRIDIQRRLLRAMWEMYQEQQEKIQELLRIGLQPMGRHAVIEEKTKCR